MRLRLNENPQLATHIPIYPNFKSTELSSALQPSLHMIPLPIVTLNSTNLSRPSRPLFPLPTKPRAGRLAWYLGIWIWPGFSDVRAQFGLMALWYFQISDISLKAYPGVVRSRQSDITRVTKDLVEPVADIGQQIRFTQGTVC